MGEGSIDLRYASVASGPPSTALYRTLGGWLAALLFLTLGLTTAARVEAQAQPAPPPRCAGADGFVGTNGIRTFVFHPGILSAQRTAMRQDVNMAATLRTRANAALARPLGSVMDKTRLPPSGDRHDYMSIGPYWWPNPDTADGLPYVRRDGRTNPERSGTAFDQAAFTRMMRDIETLSLGAYVLDDQRYAEAATSRLRHWFVNPATRMNPNLNYAQAVPGINEGRAEGIIEANALVPVVESIGMLTAGGALTPQDQAALEGWFGALADWMATSRIGQEEAAAHNNHALYYDALLMQFALFARQQDRAAQIASGWRAARLRTQMAPDGSLPAELTRTRPFHYSLFSLIAMVRTASMAECSGIDLWTAEPDGRGIALLIRWLRPYLLDPSSWTRPDNDWEDTSRHRLVEEWQTLCSNLAFTPLRDEACALPAP